MGKFYANDFLKQMLEDLSALGRPVVRPVRTLDELQQVYRLTHECYVSNGFAESHRTGLVVHYPHYDHIPETTILIAILEGKIVGSVSYTIDGPSGFTLDEDFRPECDSIREEGKRVGVVWRLVVDKSVRSNRAVVSDLIDGVIKLAVEYDVPTVLFAVNPRHENVYKRMLRMEVVERRQATEGLTNAPAVLLRGDRDTILRINERPNLVDADTVSLFQMLASSPYLTR